MRCSAFSFPTYFTPKSLTTRVNWMALHLCVHSPRTSLLWVYFCLVISFLSSSFLMGPAWGRPYMPFRISAYTLPSVFPFSCRLYSFMIPSVMSHNFSLRYSYRAMVAFK